MSDFNRRASDRGSGGGGGAPGYRRASDDININHMLRVLWRKRLVIIGIVLITGGMTAIFLSFIKTHYTGTTHIKIENINNAANEINQPRFMPKLETEVVLSEVEVLKSQSLAREVIQRLGLDENGKPSTKFLPLRLGEVTDTDAVRRMSQTSPAAIEAFLKKLSVRPVPDSYVIQVNFSATDPALAARVANTIADVYIERRLEQKLSSAQRLAKWLQGRLESLRDQVRISEAAVEKFRQDNNLPEQAQAESVARQMAELGIQLARARATLAQSEALITENTKEGVGPTAKNVLESRLIQGLRLEEAELLSHIAELSRRYGERHPDMIAARSELSLIRSQIASETDRIRRNYVQERDIAQASIASLEAQLRELETLDEDQQAALIKMRELQREADSNRVVYANFLENYKKISSSDMLQDPDAQIISYSTIPTEPSYPNRPLLTILVSASTFFFMIALLLVMDRLNTVYRTGREVERETRLPCYGLIPMAGSKGDRRQMSDYKIGDYIVDYPASTVAEAVRAVRTSITLRLSAAGQTDEERARKLGRIVTTTSSYQNEGKSTLAIWLAHQAALAGERVLIIDCDLRRPSLHRLSALEGDMTLVDVLADFTKLTKAVRKDPRSGLDILFGKSVPSSALDLLASSKMSKLIEHLRQAYDMVILDGPACLAVADSRILSLYADQTLYCVQWDKVPAEVVDNGIKQFAGTAFKGLAIVLTQVNLKRQARYGYGDIAYYGYPATEAAAKK